jgi:hypothetical protein
MVSDQNADRTPPYNLSPRLVDTFLLRNDPMQIKNLFNRKKIALLGLLIIVLISIENPFPNISEFINRGINLNKANIYNCLEEHIPKDEDVLFIGNPFDELSIPDNLALYYRSQYFLAPRLVVLMESNDKTFSINLYSWFIGTSMNEQHLRELEDTHRLIAVRKCGNLLLLHKTPQR